MLATNYIEQKQAESILHDANELCKILAKIKITTTTKLSQNS